MKNKYNLNHTKCECKYHLTWIPKYRKKQLFGDIRNYLGEVFRELARGYHVSTVGRDEEAIRKYIREQEREDRRIDQHLYLSKTRDVALRMNP